MAMYALAVVPLIGQLRAHVPEACQAWFADDATAVGPLSSLFQWWRHLSSAGPDFGYFPNASKTVLIVKPEHLAAAESIFASTSIQITAQGQRHLGAALGTRSFTEAYVTQKVATWTAEVTALAGVASTRPHAAYCAFTHGMIGHWMYVMRTIPDISPLFKPLEDAIYLKLLPSFTGHSCSLSECDLLSLPCRLGGLGIVNPTIIADSQFDASIKITNPLKDLIMNLTAQLPGVTSIKNKIHMVRRMAHKEQANAIRTHLSPSLQRAMDLNSEIGSSSLLTVLPLHDQGFHLHKQEFWDALHLRYGWKLADTLVIVFVGHLLLLIMP